MLALFTNTGVGVNALAKLVWVVWVSWVAWVESVLLDVCVKSSIAIWSMTTAILPVGGVYKIAFCSRFLSRINKAVSSALTCVADPPPARRDGYQPTGFGLCYRQSAIAV